MIAPPRLARRLLRLAVRRDLLEFLEGDLDEEFSRRTAACGAAAARRWYWGETLAAAAHLTRRRARPALQPNGDHAMPTFLRDLRFGGRALLKSPGYSLVITLTVALAIGANTIIFSFANPFLIKPMPIADQARIAFIYSVDPQRATMRGRSSYLDFLDWRVRLRSFASLAAWTDTNATLTGRGDAERLQARLVTPNLFATWGLQPVAGRLLREGDEQPGRPCIVVLSDHLWASKYQRDPSAISRSIVLDGRACTIAGVLTPAIELGNLSLVDVWMPLVDDPMAAWRDVRTLAITGRLNPGVTVDGAGAEAEAVAEQLQREHPDTNAGWTASTLSSRAAMAGTGTFVILGMLALVVAFVLLIACANVANLMMARITGRRRELAVRAALGATRWTLVRELVAESCWLGAAGGAAGLAAANASLRLIRAASAEPFFQAIVIDHNVVLFAFGLSFLTPLLFSVIPALHSSDASASELKEGARSSGSVRARRSRAALVVAQVSLALMLLVVAGLVLRTVVEMTRVAYGFDASPVLTAEIELPKWKDWSPEQEARYYVSLLTALRRSADVQAAAVTSTLPVVANGARTQFDVAGRPVAADQRPWAYEFRASDGYFEAMGIPVLRGRAFADADRAGQEPVALVDAEAARRYWPASEDALGARISVAPPGSAAPHWMRVVGVVGNVADANVESPVAPHVYVSMLQQPAASVAIVVRTAAPERAVAAVREAVASIDRDVALFRAGTLSDRLDQELSSTRILMMLFVAFAVIALTLAASGLYAVISYSVGQRTQEIGVRIALGAVAADIHRLVFTQGIRLVALGGVIGLAGAGLLGRALSSILFKVTPFDPITYASVIALVLTSSGIAIVVPAWRATRLDPVRSLRAE